MKKCVIALLGAWILKKVFKSPTVWALVGAGIVWLIGRFFKASMKEIKKEESEVLQVEKKKEEQPQLGLVADLLQSIMSETDRKWDKEALNPDRWLDKTNKNPVFIKEDEDGNLELYFEIQAIDSHNGGHYNQPAIGDYVKAIRDFTERIFTNYGAGSAVQFKGSSLYTDLDFKASDGEEKKVAFVKIPDQLLEKFNTDEIDSGKIRGRSNIQIERSKNFYYAWKSSEKNILDNEEYLRCLEEGQNLAPGSIEFAEIGSLFNLVKIVIPVRTNKNYRGVSRKDIKNILWDILENFEVKGRKLSGEGTRFDQLVFVEYFGMRGDKEDGYLYLDYVFTYDECVIDEDNQMKIKQYTL